MKLISFLCVLGNVGFLCACSTSTHITNNTNPLAGTWSCVSATVDGKRLPHETTDLLQLTLTQNRYTTKKGSDVLFDSTYTVDPSKSPKQINMIGTEGDLTGKVAPGIYSFDDDVLKICYVMPGLKRPEIFESPPGSKATLIIWKRQRL
jgi:uncharacterized protein (TIGR03067 family)